MRARSDTRIVMAAPVNHVVTTLGARPCVVGNFVGRHAGFGADRLRQIIEIARKVLVRHDQFASLVQAEEWSVRFDGQLIKRKMLRGLCYRAPEFCRPCFKRLLRPGVNQIERVAVEDRTGDCNGIERFLRRVQTSELL